MSKRLPLSFPGSLFILLCLCLCLGMVAPARAQLTRQTLTFAGGTRVWFEHVPASYDGARAVPLVLVLHGVQSTGDQFAPTSEWTPVSDQQGFIVVYPNGGLDFGSAGLGWNDFVYQGEAPDDVGFLFQLIQTLKAKYKIDPDRVYMTGFSNGASMSNTFCGVHSSVLAAMAPASSDWMTSYGIPESAQHPDGPVSSWISRGALENFQEGDQSHDVQDANQTAYWVGIDGCNPTPRNVVDGIYTTSIYTGGKGEVRYSKVAGYNHQYGPGFAVKIWNDFFSRITRKSAAAAAHPAFFTGEVPLGAGAYYLALPGGNPFGYYSYLSDPAYLYHFDLGYEYVFDANDGKDGVYLYDFQSGGFFYTSPGFAFPYLFDFALNAVLYYYPDPGNTGHYGKGGGRYFYDFATRQIITK